MGVFLVEGQREFSYAELWSAIIRGVENGPPVVETVGTFQAFACILAGLCRSHDVMLGDGSITVNGPATRFGGRQEGYVTEPTRCASFNSWPEFLEVLRRRDIGGTISLPTSGTTGRPKRVSHRLSSICRAVRMGAQHRDDVWALAYNPTRMAGLQVLFQAVLNENALVCVFGPEGRRFEVLYERYGINRISATPTYFRSLLSPLSRSYPGIRSVTTGGEKSDGTLRALLQRAFPNARIRDSYASTEAGSLLESEGGAFRIPEQYSDAMRIGDDGEFLVHERLLGESESLRLTDHWFHTGDLVERLDGGSFRFVARASSLINVGGEKVNPERIEEMIGAVAGVADVRVFGARNSVTGEVVAADVVPVAAGGDPRALREAIYASLNGALKRHEVPAIINVVESLEVTPAGKKARQ